MLAQPDIMAGWPTYMSKSFATKNVGACLKHVLNTRLFAGFVSPDGATVVSHTAHDASLPGHRR
ncbi:MAG: hypothetical protein EON55_07925 [Alphaproteobacteria bacterium]|nr:MAG: hypothetical protein EON55_07925 [Alphaproteobacteria bacterium]